MIDQGSSEQNIIVGVEEGDLDKAIRVIYDAFAGAEAEGKQEKLRSGEVQKSARYASPPSSRVVKK